MRTLNRNYSPADQFYDTIAVDNQAEFKAHTGPLNHTFLLGTDYRRVIWDYRSGWGAAPTIDVFNPIYGQPLNPPVAGSDSSNVQTNQQLGLYLQDQIKLENWILTLGGRHDWVNASTFSRDSLTETVQPNAAFTKRAGLGYEFDIGLVPYVSYSESFIPVTGTAFDGTPFDPESGKQYEAGIKYQPVGTNMRFAAAVYDLRRRNVLTADPDHPGRSIQTGEITSRGLELEAVASLTSNLNLTAAYTYNNVKVTESNDADLGKRPARTPQHVASLWADYTIREGALNGLGFGGGVRYIGKSAGDYLNTFEAPAYTLVDAMIRYEIDSWRFSVNASNLFDKYYVASCFAMSQCNLGRARTVLGTVTYRW